MQKEIAARILEAALSLGKEIGKLDFPIGQPDDANEKEDFIHALGDIMGILTRHIVLRIVREHPNLTLTATLLRTEHERWCRELVTLGADAPQVSSFVLVGGDIEHPRLPLWMGGRVV